MSTNYTPPYPIPYEHDTCYQQPPVRVLFSGGRWCVPECERPANWRSMVGIRDVEPPKKAPCLVVNMPKPRGFSQGHEKFGGRTTGSRTFKITPNEVVERRNAGESIKAIAASVGCSANLIFKRAQKATIPMTVEALCCGCGKPTRRGPASLRCAECCKAGHLTASRAAYVPHPRPVTPPCDCGGKHFARGMCKACHSRDARAKAREGQA